MLSFPRSFVFPLFVLLSRSELGLGFQPPPFDFFETRALLFYMMNGSAHESLLKGKWGLERWEASEKERLLTPSDSDPEFETWRPGFPQESMALLRCEKEQTREIGDTTGLRHSDRLAQGTVNCIGCLKQHATNLGLGQNGCITSSVHTLGTSGSCFDYPVVMDTVENSTSSGTISSYCLKDSRQLRLAHPSKNACFARPVEESEAMRKWKEIKQNGFLSHPNGGVPTPEPQHGKRCKKKTKGNDQKRKMEMANAEVEAEKGEQRKMEMAKRGQDKRKMETLRVEQDNMLKNAPSSGLLSTISTGIIRRVKNYEEVHAILEDMVRLEKPDDQIQNELIGREESRGKRITYVRNFHN